VGGGLPSSRERKMIEFVQLAEHTRREKSGARATALPRYRSGKKRGGGKRDQDKARESSRKKGARRMMKISAWSLIFLW